MGKTGPREYGELLPPDQGVHSVYRGYSSLYEIVGAVPCPGVDGRSGYVEPLLGVYRRTAVYGVSGTGEDPSQHILGNGHLHRLAEETNGCAPVYAGGPFEHLNDYHLV
ncbi:hypothetical protein SDC9_136080 [bioreactor metagenome]|uniref:Uncharacterized protein n=1 Tax=bioreactor metagenome TaxID=1076179 RepID=A0A645DK74_9ZZZZ